MRNNSRAVRWNCSTRRSIPRSPALKIASDIALKCFSASSTTRLTRSCWKVSIPSMPLCFTGSMPNAARCRPPAARPKINGDRMPKLLRCAITASAAPMPVRTEANILRGRAGRRATLRALYSASARRPERKSHAASVKAAAPTRPKAIGTAPSEKVVATRTIAGTNKTFERAPAASGLAPSKLFRVGPSCSVWVLPSGLYLPPNFCAIFYSPPSQPELTPKSKTIKAVYANF